MIRHCVFLRLRSDHDAAEVDATLADLAALCQRLPGTGDLVTGLNRDFEGRSPGFSKGFTIDFTDEAALARYADHPDHRALGARLVAQCAGRGDGIMVFDLDCDPARGRA